MSAGAFFALFQGVLYASYEHGPWFLDGVFSYARNDYDGTRYITVGGVNRVASGDYGADQVAVKATAGREYGFNSNAYLNPYVGLHYIYLGVDGYTEKGAGAANLTVQDETTQALQSTLGVSVRKEMKMPNGFQVVPEAHVAWLHEFLDEGQTNTSSFTGGGASFTSRGFDPANDSLNVGVSLAVYSRSNFDVKATYDFEVKDDYYSHSGMLAVHYNF